MYKMLKHMSHGINKIHLLILTIPLLIITIIISFEGYKIIQTNQKEKLTLENKLKSTSQKLSDLMNQDQYKINVNLKKEIDNINKTFSLSSKTFENINDLKSLKADTNDIDKEYAKILNLLANKNFSSAEAELIVLDKEIKELFVKIQPPQSSTVTNAVASNTPPGSGYQYQKVKIDEGEFAVGIVTADLNSTKVIIDTASDNNCGSNCPVLSLSDYISRNGAFAGINGSYFCPASYPSCAGKENSFDTLLMNKNKVYFNSDNNVYSEVPVVVFSGNNGRFMRRSSEWGRDSGVDAVIANIPLLVLDGNVVFFGDGEAKRSSQGTRSFIGTTDSKVYIGMVYSATTAQEAKVLQTLGIKNALHLDDGGSIALWSGGYKAGPGRNIPNAVLFINR